MARHSQIALGPMEVTPVDQARASGSTAVDQATEVAELTALWSQAVSDCGYTLDALEAAMGKNRAYIHKVLQGEKPMSAEFQSALPNDVNRRFAQLYAKRQGFIVAEPAADATDAAEKLISAAMYALAGRARGAA